MHPFYSIPNFISCALIVSLGVFVVVKRPEERINRLYGLLNLSVAHWLLGYALVYLSKDPSNALFFARSAYTGVVFIPTFFLHFMHEFLGLKRRPLLYAAYAISFIFLYVVWQDAFMPRVAVFFWGYYPQAGPIYWTWLIYFYAAFALCDFEFTRAYFIARRREPSALRTQQLKYVLYANCAASVSFMDYLPKFGVAIYPCAYLAALGWIGLTGYAILRLHLMDVQLVIRRTVVYSLVSACLVSVYVGTITGLAQVLGGTHGVSSRFSSALAAVFITLLFNPVRVWVQRLVDLYFPREAVGEHVLREITGNFVHEIKTPLANISLPAELTLLDVEDLREGRKALDDVLPKITKRMKYIIEQAMMAGSKVEAVREATIARDMANESFHLDAVLRGSLQQVDSLLQDPPIDVRLAIPAGLGPLPGSAGPLEIVFTNLLKNAAEAIRDKNAPDMSGIDIVGVKRDGIIEIQVKDTGPGIPPADLERIFQPRYTTKGPRGAGMGLPLCRQIVEAHGGTLSAQNAAGGGAVFTVELPSRAPSAASS